MRLKWYWVTGIFAAVIFLIAGVWLYRLEQKEKISVPDAEAVLYHQQVAEFTRRLADASTIAELEIIRKQLETLEKSDQSRFDPYLKLILAEAYFELAEDRITRAGDLARATGAGNQGVGDVNPLALKYANQAFHYYRQAKDIVDALDEKKDDQEYDFRLFYLKGDIYYRYLMFLASREEAKEIYNRTALSWIKALEFKPKDVLTEINLELLRRNRQQLLNGASGNTNRRLKQLPSQDKNKGRGGPHGKI